MCNPVAVMLVATAVSTAVSAYSQDQAAKAQNAQADYQAKVADRNAQTAEMEARYAEQMGERNAEAQRRRTAVMIGAQRAKMGKSGAVVDSGSFLDLTLDAAMQGELDALALRDEGHLAAWRARVTGQNYQSQGKLFGMSKVNPGLAIAGTVLKGAAQAGSGWASMSGGSTSGMNWDRALGQYTKSNPMH